MKKYILIIIVIVILLNLSYNNNYAQNVYISAGGGYGFSALSEYNYGTLNGIGINNNFTQTINNNNSSFGNGFNFGLVIGYDFSKQGYNFSKHFAAEVGISYVYGNSFEGNSYSTNQIGLNNDTDTSNNKIRGTMLRITPAIKIYSETSDFTPYLKAGIVIGILGSVVFDNNLTETVTGNANYIQKDYSERQYTQGVSFGFMGAVGCDYNINRQSSFYCELGFVCETFAPKQSEYITYTIDGQNYLITLPTNQKQFTYSNNYTYTSSPDPNQPTQGSKIYFPFSDWGFNIGFKYKFGN